MNGSRQPNRPLKLVPETAGALWLRNFHAYKTYYESVLVLLKLQ